MNKLKFIIGAVAIGLAAATSHASVYSPAETSSAEPPGQNIATRFNNDRESISQTTGPTISLTNVVISTNPTQQTGFDNFLNSIGAGTLTNASADLYLTWAPKAPDGSSKVGGGLFIAYNFNQYAGAGLGLDWLGQFALVSGNMQFQAPFHLTTVFPLVKNVSWLQNVIIAPFTIAGVGTPYSGNGQFNGSAMVISDVGGYISFGHVWNGQFNTGVAWGKWVGQGPYGGVTRYHCFFGYDKEF